MRLHLLERSLLDLQANDPKKLAQELILRAGRVRALGQHLRAVEVALSAKAVADVITVRTEGRRKSDEAKKLRDLTFTTDALNGTGTEAWTALWEAARLFSQESAYPSQAFPVVEDGARCVLCQQGLDHHASHRLRQFETFVASTTETELRQLRQDFLKLKKAFQDITTRTEAVDETLKELRIENEEAAATIEAALTTNETRRKAIVLALTEDTDIAADCPDLASVASEADALLQQIALRIDALGGGATDQTRTSMAAEARELNARVLLGKHEQTVLDEIERRKKYAAYGVCIDETRTQPITQKSTAVTKSAVSQRLKQRFKDELQALRFRHVEVELREAGGTEGVLYHKLVLVRAPGVELPKVVSEGEQRCLSIAAFFAELCTADDPSGIVFDDPVSSLDYKWRESVAQRLVEEAKTRQVIVFTHDIVFLNALKQCSYEQHVEQLDQHVRQFAAGAGVCEEDLPWPAMNVKKKIGYLKNAWQDADKLFRDGKQSAYEREAQFLYGYLREGWERALEETLLGGIVERFRPSIQTQQIAAIADITADDCGTLEAAMTKCSQWLPGHDKAAAARAPVPEPTELKSDIEALESWVTAIRKRRRQ